MKKYRMGEIQNSNNCGMMEIIEYINCNNIKVKFKTGTIIKAEYRQFQKGNVKDPLYKSVLKMGYIGIGKFKPSINRKHTIEYKTWCNMLQRCYDPYCINRQPTYQNVTVCKEWLNFQNFAEWFNKNYYELIDEDVELDKDIIRKGNKIYCPEFCSFVPKLINLLLNKRNKSRGKYLIGVSFDKNRNKYQSQMSIDGKRERLGSFKTEIEAFMIYKKEKEKQIKIMTNKYKSVLETKVFRSLMQYEIKISD